MKTKEGGMVRVFRIKIPKKTSDEFDKLIENGVYITYADAIRHAIELLLKEHGEDEWRKTLNLDVGHDKIIG